jgi:hypothetical protein
MLLKTSMCTDDVEEDFETGTVGMALLGGTK